MSDSIENKLLNFSKAVNAPPIPTLLQRPEKVNEDLVGGGGGGGAGTTLCGVFIPSEYSWTIFMAYTTIIAGMYCREGPVAGCMGVFVGAPMDGSITGEGQVTDRDLPLTWQRTHPEFDPADPGTWGSVFGPGGFAEKMVRWWHCYAGRDGFYGTGECPGTSDAQINAMVEMLRQLYIAKCGFAVSSAGACCTASEFGGFTCAPAAGAGACKGTFFPGKSCAQIDNDNCGLQQNPLQQNPNEQKKAAGELIKQLKLFKRK